MDETEETNSKIIEECIKNKVDNESKVEDVNSEKSRKNSHVSEYDSVGEYSDGEVENNPESKQSDDESDQSVVLEREEGDGQESVPPKKIDDDEDKKNPQYIPKRGTFYEHDDRTMEDDEIKAEEKEKADKDGKKKIWTDKKENWSHDKFNDTEQAPKSRSELIAIYGYDIRNEEGPPRARRRRRYGRGPNKYTRNWEDEDAYSKPPIVITKKVGKKINGKSSPTNDRMEQQNNKNKDTGNSSGQSSLSYEDHANNSTSEQNVSNQSNQNNERAPKNNYSVDNRQSNRNQRPGTGRVTKPTREIKDSDFRGMTKPRQYSVKPQGVQEKEQIQSQNYSNKKVQDVTNNLGKMNLQDQQGSSKTKHGSNRQSTVPPRLQGENKGSKRYSSIRQRSLPESITPPFTQQQHNYYNVETYQSPQVTSTQVQPQAQQIIHQSAQILPNPSQIAPISQQPLATIPQQVPVTASLPPQFAAPFPQAPPAFLQTAPPQFLPQQTTPIINYVAGVPGQPSFAPPQPTFQGYQQPFNPVSQTTEIQFQPPGGITYYSPQEQQAAQRAALQKRPKAAIPIVPPPPEHKGRGRIASHDAALLQPGDGIESLEVDNQNEQNYEDVVA